MLGHSPFLSLPLPPPLLPTVIFSLPVALEMNQGFTIGKCSTSELCPSLWCLGTGFSLHSQAGLELLNIKTVHVHNYTWLIVISTDASAAA